MVSFKIVTGHTQTPLVSMYLPPSMLEHLPDFEEALQQFKGLDPIVLGDFNLDLDNERSSQIQHVVDVLMEFGIIDLVQHF